MTTTTLHRLFADQQLDRPTPGSLLVVDEAGMADIRTLNQALLAAVQASGELFLSNAVVDGRYLLRACVVNFNTTQSDIEAVPETVTRLGRDVDAELRSTM